MHSSHWAIHLQQLILLYARTGTIDSSADLAMLQAASKSCTFQISIFLNFFIFVFQKLNNFVQPREKSIYDIAFCLRVKKSNNET